MCTWPPIRPLFWSSCATAAAGHCDILQKIKETGSPIWLATSGYLATVDEDACTGCGTCEENCQLDAIALNDEDKAAVDKSRCVGCGVCANLCPVEAIFMEAQEDAAEPPQNSPGPAQSRAGKHDPARLSSAFGSV